MSSTPPPDQTPAEPPADGGPPGAEAPETPAAPAPARRWRRRRAEPAPPAETPPGEEAAAPPQPTEAIPAVEGPALETPAEPRPPGPSRLRRDRRKLLTQREEAVYHLGGLAFELYRRDQLPDGVMRRRAVEVAQLDDTVRDIDVRLGEIERERRERRSREPEDPHVGCCLVCRTPFRAEARFCWQCGTQVVPPPLGGDDQPTAVISSPDAA